jgi:hypothetical protein
VREKIEKVVENFCLREQPESSLRKKFDAFTIDGATLGRIDEVL